MDGSWVRCQPEIGFRQGVRAPCPAARGMFCSRRLRNDLDFPAPKAMSHNVSRKLIDFIFLLLIPFIAVAPCWSASLKCDLAEYKARSGLTAAVQGEVVVVTWSGAD